MEMPLVMLPFVNLDKQPNGLRLSSLPFMWWKGNSLGPREARDDWEIEGEFVPNFFH